MRSSKYYGKTICHYAGNILFSIGIALLLLAAIGGFIWLISWVGTNSHEFLVTFYSKLFTTWSAAKATDVAEVTMVFVSLALVFGTGVGVSMTNSDRKEMAERRKLEPKLSKAAKNALNEEAYP